MCLHFLSGAGEGFRGSGVRCGSGVGLTRWGPSCPELLGAGRARLQTTALKNKPPAAWQGVLGLPQCTRGARQALAVGGVQRAQQCWGRRAVRGACGVSSRDGTQTLDSNKGGYSHLQTSVSRLLFSCRPWSCRQGPA